MEQDMLPEKQGRPGWKNKLDEVADLPDFVLPDKNASWGKLHNRLQEKPGRIGAAWYWAAAAGILIVCAIPLFTTKNARVAKVKNESLKNFASEPMIKQESLPGKSKTNVPVEPAHHKTDALYEPHKIPLLFQPTAS